MLLRPSARFRLDSETVRGVEWLGFQQDLKRDVIKMFLTCCEILLAAHPEAHSGSQQWQRWFSLAGNLVDSAAQVQRSSIWMAHLPGWLASPASLIQAALNTLEKDLTYCMFLTFFAFSSIVNILLNFGSIFKMRKSFTRGVTAALCRQNPGMSEASCVLGHPFVRSAVLLPDFTVGLSTDSTGLASHPVNHFNLCDKNFFSHHYSTIIMGFHEYLVYQICEITWVLFELWKTSWRP